MESKFIVITTDGKETEFNGDAKINFLQDHLLITIQTSLDIMGIHWDRFAGLIRILGKDTDSSVKSMCTALLRFGNGREKKLDISQFQKCDLVLSRNMINIIGSNTIATLNLDYIQWYRIYR